MNLRLQRVEDFSDRLRGPETTSRVGVMLGITFSGQGGKPDNDSILNRPYFSSWLVLTVVMFVGVAAYAAVLRLRTKAVTAS